VNKFSERLKELREEKGLNLATLGKELGVSYVAIGRWERGTRIPNMDSLIAIAKFFNVSIDYLVGSKDF